MFVRNRTGFAVHLARAHVNDDLGVAALLVEVVHAIGEGGFELVSPSPERRPSDPPEPLPYVRWEGVGVTAAGTAHGPGRAPHVQPVVLHVGAETRRLIVFGDRHWEPSGGVLRATPAAPFEAISIGFDRAYGGSFDVPPGILPGVDLPHPGFRASYPLNGGGIGFYLDAAQARGGLLPNIERPDQLVKAWSDQPVPAGFSPCPDLTGLRLRKVADERFAGKSAEEAAAAVGDANGPPFLLQHHAPGALVFDAIASDAPIVLEGLGAGPVHTRLPPPPLSVAVRTGKQRSVVPPRVRSVHVDADARLQRTLFDHAFFYPVTDPPNWVVLRAAGG